MKSLRRVEFRQFVTGEAMSILARQGNLVELGIETPAVSDEVCAHLPEITSVKRLSIRQYGNALQSEGIKSLKRMTGLETLSFDIGYGKGKYMRFTADDIRAVWKALPNCTVTFFDKGTQITLPARVDERAFAASFLEGDRVIRVAIENGETTLIAEASDIQEQPFQIVEVQYGRNRPATDDDLRQLGEANLPHLESVNLGAEPFGVTPAGLAAFAADYPTLKEIRLHDLVHVRNNLDGIQQAKEFLAALSLFPSLERLETEHPAGARDVWIDGTTPEVLRQLKEAPKLEAIALGAMNRHQMAIPGSVTPDDVRALAKEMPHCSFLFLDGGSLVTLNNSATGDN